MSPPVRTWRLHVILYESVNEETSGLVDFNTRTDAGITILFSMRAMIVARFPMLKTPIRYDGIDDFPRFSGISRHCTSC